LGRELGVLYTSFFEQAKRPGGAVACGGENLKKGLDPEAWQGGVRGKDAPSLYTRIFEQAWRSGGPVASGAGASEKRIETRSSETVVVGEAPAARRSEIQNSHGGAGGAVRDDREGNRRGSSPRVPAPAVREETSGSTAVSCGWWGGVVRSEIRGGNPGRKGQASEAFMHGGFGGNHHGQGASTS
jgi:hypothetical protein